MAQRRRQSLKARRKDKKRHTKNVQIKTAIKKSLKELQAALTSKNSDAAKKCLRAVTSKLAKAAKKDIIHKNAAQRKISRLSKRVTTLTAS